MNLAHTTCHPPALVSDKFLPGSGDSSGAAVSLWAFSRSGQILSRHAAAVLLPAGAYGVCSRFQELAKGHGDGRIPRPAATLLLPGVQDSKESRARHPKRIRLSILHEVRSPLRPLD